MSGLILFEDDHLLAVHKPSGINTHKPDSFTPDGIHEWLCKRYGHLSILHRLDKDTSGVLLFGKTRAANQSLARQFAQHTLEKEYLLLTTHSPRRRKFLVDSAGAVTEFEWLDQVDDRYLLRASPITGKTHQIRRQARECGCPIVGDTEYEGAPAPRLMLHAHSLRFQHPVTDEWMKLEASVPAAFEKADALVAAREFRQLLFDDDTNAFRLISGAADGFPDVIVDSYDGTAFVQWQRKRGELSWLDAPRVVEQVATKQGRTQPTGPARFPVRENGLTFLIGFGGGLSPGMFLDQRENRRRLLTSNLTGQSVLNCFAYTCAFSVAAAKAGAVTTSVDLSRKYLEWGRENFDANRLDATGHEFIAGDVFEWLRRFAKRGRAWDVVLLDPPTFSTTKKGRAFQAERDYRALAVSALAVVKAGGTLFCSTNQRTFSAERFEKTVREAARDAGRPIAALEFETLPFDFRVAAGERPYLKTFWVRLAE